MPTAKAGQTGSCCISQLRTARDRNITDGYYLLLDSNALGAWALRAMPFGVFHGLAFAQTFKRTALDGRMMEKQVASFPLDESKALVRNQLFDHAL